MAAALCLAAIALSGEGGESRPFARFLFTNVHYSYLERRSTSYWPVRLTLTLRVPGAHAAATRYARMKLSVPGESIQWVTAKGKEISFDSNDLHSETFTTQLFSPSSSATIVGPYRVELTGASGGVLSYDYSPTIDQSGTARMLYNEAYDGLVTLFHREALPYFVVESARVVQGDPPSLEIRFLHPDVPPPATLSLLVEDESGKLLPGKSGNIPLGLNDVRGLKRGAENIVLVPLPPEAADSLDLARYVSLQAVEASVPCDDGGSELALGSIGPTAPIIREAAP